MTLSDLERRNGPYFSFFSRNSTNFQADYITVVEDRPILSVKYCLPVPVFYLAKTITHPAARSLCDSWASCYDSPENQLTKFHPLLGVGITGVGIVVHTPVTLGLFFWNGPGRSLHVIDHSGQICLIRGKRTVKVIAYWLFHSPLSLRSSKLHTTCSTLQYFAKFGIFKCRSNLFIMETMIHEQQTQICDLQILQYCTVALAKVTDNLQPPQRYWNVLKLYRSKHYVIYTQMH